MINFNIIVLTVYIHIMVRIHGYARFEPKKGGIFHLITYGKNVIIIVIIMVSVLL